MKQYQLYEQIGTEKTYLHHGSLTPEEGGGGKGKCKACIKIRNHVFRVLTSGNLSKEEDVRQQREIVTYEIFKKSLSKVFIAIKYGSSMESTGVHSPRPNDSMLFIGTEKSGVG